MTDTATSQNGLAVNIAPVATLDKPYSLAFLPDGRILVTEAFNGLRIVTTTGVISAPLTGLPPLMVVPFEVLLDPQYATNHLIYLSYAEKGLGSATPAEGGTPDGEKGTALSVASATLTTDASGGGALSNVKVIWRQKPKVDTATGEYGGKLAFSPDHRYLFIATGDRSTFTPAQDLTNTLGKIVRIFPDGTIPPDGPFVGKPGAPPEMWTLGHRNPYGLAFDAAGNLWSHENGPQGGDEFNLITSGGNYGWPSVSWGDNYDGGLIPKPSPNDGFVAPLFYWTPAIAPSGLIFYSGKRFPSLAGEAILGGLQSQGLVFVKTTGTTSAIEVDRLPLGHRIRNVAQGPDGAIWVLEDSPSCRLLKLTPRTG